MRYRLKKSDKYIMLPKRIIDRLGIKEGDEAMVDIKEDKIIITPKIDIIDKLVGIASSSKSSMELHEEFKDEVEKSLI